MDTALGGLGSLFFWFTILNDRKEMLSSEP